MVGYITSIVAGLAASAIAAPHIQKRGTPNGGRFVDHSVINSNFADPSFIQEGDTYYAFSTTNGVNVPVAKSSSFLSGWSIQDKQDALPTVGKWSNGQNVWAPQVTKLSNGKFVMYYSATSTDKSGHHCVGAATSDTVDGPYQPVDTALACPLAQGGAIDPSGFVDKDGSVWVVYKVDGNSIGHGGNCGNSVKPIVPTPIMLQQMEADGVTPKGDPKQILDRGDADGPLVEAPSLTRVDDSYFLFFSSNCYSGSLYDTSFAYYDGQLGAGSFAKSKSPLLVTGSNGGLLYSPGGAEVNPAGDSLVFHSDQAKSADVRVMWARNIKIDSKAHTVNFV